MTTKHYLTAILIFALIFLSAFSGKAQNSSDIIRAEKTIWGGYTYFKDNEMISFDQVKRLIAENEKAYNLLKDSRGLRINSYMVAFVGGGCVGYALAEFAILGNMINRPVVFSVLGAGVALIGIGIGLDAAANKKLKTAITIYNQSKRENNHANLYVGFSPNGVNMRLNF